MGSALSSAVLGDYSVKLRYIRGTKCYTMKDTDESKFMFSYELRKIVYWAFIVVFSLITIITGYAVSVAGEDKKTGPIISLVIFGILLAALIGSLVVDKNKYDDILSKAPECGSSQPGTSTSPPGTSPGMLLSGTYKTMSDSSYTITITSPNNYQFQKTSSSPQSGTYVVRSDKTIEFSPPIPQTGTQCSATQKIQDSTRFNVSCIGEFTRTYAS